MTVTLSPMHENPHGYPAWSLQTDHALRRAVRTALVDRDIAISLSEGFVVRRNKDVRDLAPDLDLICELGVKRINVVSLERDWNRTIDQFATLVDMANTLGIESMTEIGTGPLPNLTTALAAIRAVDQPNFRLLIDTMHYFRLGSTIADLAEVDPALVGYVQLCDVPAVPKISSYLDEAMHERMVPGTGDLPLLDLMAVIPSEVVIGIEVPQRSLAASGLGPEDRLRPCVEATRQLLAKVASARSHP
jgi:sugar phosphate isomerase/epimerase